MFKNPFSSQKQLHRTMPSTALSRLERSLGTEAPFSEPALYAVQKTIPEVHFAARDEGHVDVLSVEVNTAAQTQMPEFLEEALARDPTYRG